MKASRAELMAAGSVPASATRETAPSYSPGAEGEIDLQMLEDSLAKTPWERMQANDDALRFAESLRAAMLKRDARP